MGTWANVLAINHRKDYDTHRGFKMPLYYLIIVYIFFVIESRQIYTLLL